MWFKAADLFSTPWWQFRWQNFTPSTPGALCGTWSLDSETKALTFHQLQKPLLPCALHPLPTITARCDGPNQNPMPGALKIHQVFWWGWPKRILEGRKILWTVESVYWLVINDLFFCHWSLMTFVNSIRSSTMTQLVKDVEAQSFEATPSYFPLLIFVPDADGER